MEDIVSRALADDSNEKIIIERINDQQLLYSKLEEKFRTIMRERLIIEDAIGGIVDFE